MRQTPLSYGQERLWFLHQLDPNGAAYVYPIALRLVGDLDGEALQGALNEIVGRHEVLRTRFESRDGVPVQVIDPPGGFRLAHRDVSNAELSGEDELVAAEAVQPFDLEKGPLFRASLLRSTPRQHLLVMSAHHSVFDGWSEDVLARELLSSYGALISGRQPSFPRLPLQYRDFAAQQRRRIDSASNEGIAYWVERLSDVPMLDLPTDWPRPSFRGSAGGIVPFEVGPSVARGLGDLATTHDATLFMCLMMCLQILISRYSGLDDVAIGTPISSRSSTELEDLIGFFVNTVVIRTSLAGDPTLSELLGRVRTQAEAAYAHGEVPFDRVVDAVGVPRDLSRTPLFSVLLALDDRAEFQLPGLAVEPLRVDRRGAQFDLSFLFRRERDGALSGEIEYSSELFEVSSIDRMAGHLSNVLAEVATW